ncbi:hypothetical protein WHR41_04618 [Cladosporium halotolerans]|uniref:RRM domain-containing protein n=1 Tax=Cladosporium halotolerans TaxID=1052096 RepID=A0AB34KR84_9PEZI
MAAEKKRKSVDSAATVAKKAKTAPSAEKPAPVKSALKKSGSKVEAAAVTEKKSKDNGKKEKVAAKAKKSADKPAVAAAVKEVEPASEDDDEESNELTADQTAELLAGFSSSEDEGSDAEEDEGVALSKIPNAPNVGAVQKHIAKKTGTKERDPETTPGTVHLSRLPHGFFEPQLRAYLSQFGTVTHLRLARNRKTGKSKHFAFVEFASSAVSDIVAKTMDKYLLFGHIMQARRVPDEQITEDFWKGEGKKRVAPRNKLEGVRLRKGVSREGWEKRVEREEQKRLEKAEKMKELGYKFDMPAVRGVDDVPVQKVLKQADEEPKAIESGTKEPEVAVKTVVEEPSKVTVTEEKTKKRAAPKEGKAKTKKAKKN